MGIIAVLVGAIVAHEAARASAVLSAVAVVSAVLLGRAAYSASTESLRQAKRATLLAHRPVLVPMHDTPGMSIKQSDGIGLDGTIDPSFPASERYAVIESPVTSRVFRVNARAAAPDAPRASVFLQNVGRGPALVTSVRLRNLAGHDGSAIGPVAIGAGEYLELVIDLRSEGATPERGARADLPPALTELEANRVFLLELVYEDVFADRRRYGLRAWFDPRQHGAWTITAATAPSEF